MAYRALRIGAATAILFTAGHAFADDADTLSADTLARCAEKVETLRAEGTRLSELAGEHDTKRQALQEEREAIGDSEERRTAYNRRAEAFNEGIKRYVDELAAINETKDAYDRDCANRPYARSDLEALPEERQQAMRRGLSDVRIPYDGRN